MPKTHQELFNDYYALLMAEVIAEEGADVSKKMDEYISWAEKYAQENKLDRPFA